MEKAKLTKTSIRLIRNIKEKNKNIEKLTEKQIDKLKPQEEFCASSRMDRKTRKYNTDRNLNTVPVLHVLFS